MMLTNGLTERTDRTMITLTAHMHQGWMRKINHIMYVPGFGNVNWHGSKSCDKTTDHAGTEMTQNVVRESICGGKTERNYLIEGVREFKRVLSYQIQEGTVWPVSRCPVVQR